MKPLTVNELIAELQVVSQRGHGDKPVIAANETELFAGNITSIWDMNDERVALTLEASDPTSDELLPPVPEGVAVINVREVEASLRAKMIPTTKRMSTTMNIPMVEVTGASIEDAMNVIFDNATESLPSADMITVETVAQTLAKLAGYGLNRHGRWQYSVSPIRYCEEGDTTAFEAGFRVGEPLNNNPRCDACCLCNALVPRNDVLTCRGCWHELKSI